MEQKIIVTYGRDENGHDLPILVWFHDASRFEIEAKYRELLPDATELGWQRQRPVFLP